MGKVVLVGVDVGGNKVGVLVGEDTGALGWTVTALTWSLWQAVDNNPTNNKNNFRNFAFMQLFTFPR